MAYILPQVKVFQEFNAIAATTVNKNAFVFGPHFQVMRDVALGSYDPEGVTAFAYPDQAANSVIDTGFTSVVLSDVWARYASVPSSATIVLGGARNKLVAAPLVGEAKAIPSAKGVELEVGGLCTNGPALPETYYLVPFGGSESGEWKENGIMSRLNDIPGEAGQDAKFKYYTSSGATGIIDIPASAKAMTAGNTVAGPNGLVLDFDPGVLKYGDIHYSGNPSDSLSCNISGTTISVNPLRNTAEATFSALVGAIISRELDACHIITGANTGFVRVIGEDLSSLSITIDSTTTEIDIFNFDGLRPFRQFKITGFRDRNSFFTVDLRKEAISHILSQIISTGIPFKFGIDYDDIYGILYGFASTADELQKVVCEGGDLASLRENLLSNSDFMTLFEVSSIEGEESAEFDSLVILGASIEPGGEDKIIVDVIPDAFAITVQPNDYIFSTANGIQNSYHFKSRGVRVGDRVRWEYENESQELVSGYSKVTGFETEYSDTTIDTVTFGESNKASFAATDLSRESSTDITLVPGVDNQRKFDGTYTGVYALDAVNAKFLGDFAAGVVEDNVKITITNSGMAGVARASVESTKGTYNNVNVPIISFGGGIAGLYLGQNLWVSFDKGTLEDGMFHKGDTYMFNKSVKADFAAIDSSVLNLGGKYTGTKDTTYIVEVFRGGVFDRVVRASEGLSAPSYLEISFDDNVSASDGVTIGDHKFGFGSYASQTVSVTAGSDLKASLKNLAKAINEAIPGVVCIVNDSSIKVKAPALILEGATSTGTATIRTAELTPTLDFTAWRAGDVNDEYTLRCKKTGDATTAEFDVSSIRGDRVSSVKFDGSGNITIGSFGLKATLTTENDPVFQVGDFWVIHVFAARPMVKVFDTLGVDRSSFIVVNDNEPIPLGFSGINFTFRSNANNVSGFVPNGGLCKGDVFYVSAGGVVAGAARTIVLADDLPSEVVKGSAMDATKFSLDFFLTQDTAEIPSAKVQDAPNYNWQSDTSALTIFDGIQVLDSSWDDSEYLDVVRADVNATYRALLTDYSDGVYAVSSVDDVISFLGEISPDNPLAAGAYHAILNSGGMSVLFSAVPSNDLAGFASTLTLSELNSDIHAMVPITQDTEIINSVVAHVKSLSTEEAKKWRMAYVGLSLPRTSDIYTDTTSEDGSPWLATIKDDLEHPERGNTLLEIINGDPEALTDVRQGDVVRFNFATDAWGNITWDETTVAERPTSSRTVRLVSGPDIALGIPQKFEILRKNNVQQMTDIISARHAAFNNRRIVPVFPAEARVGTTTYTAEFAAAQAAGLACAVAPQQGLTNVELVGFTDIPMVYRMFSRAQLNQIAEAGTLIIMQESSGGRVYVRHQLTSAASSGVLEHSEISLVKNLDNVSYRFAEVVAPYVGAYNLTEEIIRLIRARLDSEISILTNHTNVDLVGPQLLAEGTEIVSIQQHPVLKDHLICVINVQLPAPLNVIQLHIVV